MWPFKKKIQAVEEKIAIICRHCEHELEKHVFPNGQYTWRHVDGGILCPISTIKDVHHAEPK